MIALCIAVIVAQTPYDPEARLFAGKPKIDPTPYTSALAGKFFECLEAEGLHIPPEQAVVVHRSLTNIGVLIARTNAAGDCTSSHRRLDACVGEVRVMTCASLHTSLTGVMGKGGEAPAWAMEFATSLTDRVKQCYASETGAGLDAIQLDDLKSFSQLLAMALGASQGLCKVKRKVFDVCMNVVKAITCPELSLMLSEQAAETVQSVIGSCGGFFDCEFGRDR